MSLPCKLYMDLTGSKVHTQIIKEHELLIKLAYILTFIVYLFNPKQCKQSLYFVVNLKNLVREDFEPSK